MAELAELNDELIRLLGQAGQVESIRQEQQAGDGVKTLQELAASDIIFEGGNAPAVRVVVSTDGISKIVLLIAGAGEMAKKDQLTHQADAVPSGVVPSAAYVPAEMQSVITTLNDLVAKFNALLAEQQAKQHML